MSEDLNFGISLKDAIQTRRLKYSKPELDMVQEIITNLKSMYQDQLRGIKLVGSRARGDARADSDWDFLVFINYCDYDIELPRLEPLNTAIETKHHLGEISISPLSEDKIAGIEKKYSGIFENFHKDAVDLLL